MCIRDRLRRGGAFGGLVIDDLVVNIDEVDLTFEGVGDISESKLKGLLDGFGLDSGSNRWMVDTEDFDAVIFDLAGLLAIIEDGLFFLGVPSVTESIGDMS